MTMCDDHALSRRRFLGAGMLAAGAVLAPAGLRKPLPRPRLSLASVHRPVDPSGNPAWSMAMHVHSSFSEMAGSMDAQLGQATQNLVDVCWWTDHADRVESLGYRTVVHFTSLTGEAAPAGEGKPWHWTPRTTGSPASRSGGIVTSPVSPGDPAGGSLQVQCQAQAGLTAGYGFYANSQPAAQPAYNYRANLAGQMIEVDVNPDAGWASGYLEIRLALSRQSSGTYGLSYRIVPGSPGSGSATTQGTLGVCTVPVPAGQFTTVTLSPDSDLAALFPAVDCRDFGLFGFTLNAVSTGDDVSGYFGYLRFDRTLSGPMAMSQQQSMMAALQPSYPLVQQYQGLEVSWRDPHLNWFGTGFPFPSLTNSSGGEYGPAGWLAYLWQAAVPQIHAAGGMASYNHPFGTKALPAYPQATQDSMLAATAAALLGGAGVPPALGCDLLEAGYPLRGGVDLAHHVALWDVLSRNAVFVTGTGVNDDHQGQDWYGDVNNWATSAWAPSTGQGDLLAALASGRAWTGSLSAYALSGGAALDMLVDGSVPMGKASVSSLPSRQLAATALGIPPGGSLAVLQGAVDYAGQNGLGSTAAVVASFTDAQVAASGGTVTLPVDTSSDSYARTVVADQTGKVVGLSNPVWLLRNSPPNGIPSARQA